MYLQEEPVTQIKWHPSSTGVQEALDNMSLRDFESIANAQPNILQLVHILQIEQLLFKQQQLTAIENVQSVPRLLNHYRFPGKNTPAENYLPFAV